MAEQQHGGERSPHYLYVFIALAIFTALEIGVSYVPDLPDELKLGALVGLAIAKVALVVLWFMHLRYDRWIFAVPFVLGLLLAVPLVLIVALSLEDEEAARSPEAAVSDTTSRSDDAPLEPDAAQTTSGSLDSGSTGGASTLEVTQYESGLDVSEDTLSAGAVQFRITNESPETRQLSIIRPVSSFKWMLPWGGALEGRPFETIRNDVEVPANETVDLTVNMRAGKYVLISGLPRYTIGNDYATVRVIGEAPVVQEGSGEGIILTGEQLVNERCTVCHDREPIDSADKSPEEWAETVDRMIGYGAQLNEKERQAVIDYLAETH